MIELKKYTNRRDFKTECSNHIELSISDFFWERKVSDKPTPEQIFENIAHRENSKVIYRILCELRDSPNIKDLLFHKTVTDILNKIEGNTKWMSTK